jgi:ubiquinone/menaquinone biosynthesis C-methylase UbiE
MEIFNKSYTDYWQDRVNQLTDGTKIADSEIVKLFLSMIDFKEDDSLVDMGCSFGRFYNTLSEYTKHVSGIDIEASAIERASAFKYDNLKVGPLEEMPFADSSFDKAFCWAVLDVTTQEKVFAETNRILKMNGVFLVTGKNDNYSMEDDVAFVAERNARLKDFPNHFTDIQFLIANIDVFGFKLLKGFIFEKRGDFGLAKALPLTNETINTPFYEYILILEKVKDNSSEYPVICDMYSKTARLKANEAGFANIDSYFESDFNLKK